MYQINAIGGFAESTDVVPPPEGVVFLTHMESETASTVATVVSGGGAFVKSATNITTLLTAAPHKFGSLAAHLYMLAGPVMDFRGIVEQRRIATAGTFAALSTSHDFQIEAWVYPVIRFFQYAFGLDDPSSPSSMHPRVILNGYGNVQVLVGDFVWLESGNNVYETGVWYHIAIARASGTTRLFVDGVELDSNAVTPNFTPAHLFVGDRFRPNGRLPSQPLPSGMRRLFFYPQLRTWPIIDEVRMIDGGTVYSAGFTPPTTAFADS